MTKYIGKDGVLRLLDGSQTLHGTAPLTYTPDIVTFDGVSTYANITTECILDDTNYANNFLADSNDAVFIGSTNPFALVKYLKGGASDYAVGSGALKAFYFDGTDFATALAVVDGTASGGDCFAQDGNISFKIPSDISTGANAYNANLDSDKYYIMLQATTSPSTDPDADVLCPADGQYFEISFATMDYNSPMGRPKTEESLILDRGNMNAKTHYSEMSDMSIFEPIPITFSCLLDDTYNREKIFEALKCLNPSSTYWTATGTTTKSQTKNDGTNFNPALEDSNKKTVNVQCVWNKDINTGLANYEVYFPLEEISLTEAEDGVTLSASGGCYGVIEDIHFIANRY